MRKGYKDVGTLSEWKKEDKKVYDLIIEQHGEQQVEGDWFQYYYECFEDSLKNTSLYPDKMEFSGFWSQGDGACFLGYIDIMEWLKFNKKLGKYKPLAEHIKKANMEENINIFSIDDRYCHKNTKKMDDIPWILSYDETKLSKKTLDLADELWQELEDFRIKKCDQLYMELENGYKYLTSEESVLDWIGQNETIFERNGSEYEGEVFA